MKPPIRHKTDQENMLNINFDLQVFINTHTMDWQASPAAGVWRKPLAREDKEQGHATSLVKFDAGAEFANHGHPGGEEILVLSGIFSDASGDYAAGSYFRNPPGFYHSSFSKEGCIILVKLFQFQAGDRQRIHIDTHQANWRPGIGGLEVMPLHDFEVEHTALVKWPAGEKFQAHSHFGGEEIFVISGEFIDEHGHYPAGSWLRSPHLSSHHPYVEEETIIWVKVGHLHPSL